MRRFPSAAAAEPPILGYEARVTSGVDAKQAAGGGMTRQWCGRGRTQAQHRPGGRGLNTGREGFAAAIAGPV
jgi:hypothetical protein